MVDYTLNRDQCDLLDMLSSELQDQLEESIDPDQEVSADRLCRQSALLENLGKAGQLIGLTGLSEVCTHLHNNMQQIKDLSSFEQYSFLLDTWPVYLLDYINQLRAGELTAESLAGVLEFLAEPEWPHPLPDEARNSLIDNLLNFNLDAPDTLSQPQLPRNAEAAMLSLTLTDAINPDLYEGLMIELPQQVTGFTESITIWAETANEDALLQAQRIVHTIKGSANVVGISGLANFAHYTEDLLEELSRSTHAMPGHLRQLLLDIADSLASLLDCLLDDKEPGNAELAVMQDMLDAYHQLRENGFLEEPEGVGEDSQYDQAHSSAEDAADYTVTPLAAKSVPESHQPQQNFGAQLRVGEEDLQELLHLSGESAIGTNRLLSQAQAVKQQLHQIALLHQKLTSLSDEFGQLIEVRNLFGRGIKIQDDSEMDPLELDHFNELHSFFHQLQEVATDTGDTIYHARQQVQNLEELANDQQRTNRSSQNHLLAMRMVPAKSLEARFQRCVRQACRLTGKKAELIVTGGSTPVDSHVLNALVDPLMHLLRNAVDHGIESEAQRISAGKVTAGQLTMHFGAEGQSIVVAISDDGAGLSRDNIIARARSLELEVPDAEMIDDAWLQQLIFSPGFSSRSQVNQTSGRGIGLDIVTEAVTRLNGRIHMENRPGEGCVFTLRMPMTVIAEHQLLVASGPHYLSIAVRGVEQLLFLESDSLTHEQGQLYYAYDEGKLPVYHLAQVAQLPETITVDTADAGALLIVEYSPGQRCGVLLERVIASREMVIKPLSPNTPAVPGIIGATILGDGRVAPVLDIQNVVANYNRATQNTDAWRQMQASLHRHMGQNQRPMALVVDDSLSIRRSLAQFVNDIGLDVRTAKDGFEAIDILREETPTVILVDMEMPRMNGLELTAHVRAQEQDRHIPVIMITSRNTEKHRRLATAAGVDTYLNKPFSEEELTHYIQASLQSCTLSTNPA